MLTNEEPVNVEPIEQPVSSTSKRLEIQKEVVVKATKPPKPLNAREKNFTLNIIKGMNATDSYITAGYKATRDTARANAPRLLAKDSIKAEIARLQKTHETGIIQDFVTPFKDRFIKAIETLDDLQDNGNDYVRLSATKEILDRVSPKVTRNESVKVTISDRERQRRMKVLGITDVTAVKAIPPIIRVSEDNAKSDAI